MIGNIKSKHNQKKIFICLDEKTKLELIKYNKKIQNNLNINIYNYKLFIEKYIIYETNRNDKGKEYNNNDKILFEGEYKNGKRNGKGKEYDENGKLIFEGEYLKGKRNGKGKEYGENGKLIFEGDYLKGEKWNGNGYDLNNNLIYELKDGNGFIKEYNRKGILIFEGEYKNGKKKWQRKRILL